MGKYMNPWENQIILERGNWGISLMGKRFPYVKTLNPLYCNVTGSPREKFWEHK